MVGKELVVDLLNKVLDPEVPVLSVVELGIIRDVWVENSKVVLTITPTYSGCPALDTITQDIKKILAENGFTDVQITTVLSPAWTTDWLSDAAKRKLEQYGIAPPGAGEGALVQLSNTTAKIRCPRCGSAETEIVSEFGATACKSLCRCKSCLEPFEYFKHI